MANQPWTSADQAQTVWIGGEGGLSATFLVTGGQTGDASACVQHTLGPKLLGAPPHVHANEDELSYILEGELGVQLGDQEFTMSPGQMVLKPRGVLHTFWNPGSATVRFLEFIVPGGFDRFFDEVSRLIPGTEPPDMGRVAELGSRYGLTFDLQRLGEVMSKHGVVLPGPPPA